MERSSSSPDGLAMTRCAGLSGLANVPTTHRNERVPFHQFHAAFKAVQCSENRDPLHK